MIEGDTTTYDLSRHLPGEPARSIHPGTSLLVSGPPMAGTDEFLMDVLADGAERGEGVVVVTTGESGPAAVASVVDRATDADPHRIVAVDTRSNSERTDASASRTAADETIFHADSPSDMTGIGVGITNGIERLAETGTQRGRLGVVSLSTMLAYSDRETVFKFCHVLASRLESVGYVGLFSVDAAAHDDQTIQVLKQAFDGVVELRERGGSREVRLGGIQPTPTEWTTIAD